MLQVAQRFEECPFWSLSCSKPLVSSSTGFCFFQAASLLSEASLPLLLVTLASQSLMNLVDCTDFLDSILSCFPSCLRSFPAGWNVSVLGETVTQEVGRWLWNKTARASQQMVLHFQIRKDFQGPSVTWVISQLTARWHAQDPNPHYVVGSVSCALVFPSGKFTKPRKELCLVTQAFSLSFLNLKISPP